MQLSGCAYSSSCASPRACKCAVRTLHADRLVRVFVFVVLRIQEHMFCALVHWWRWHSWLSTECVSVLGVRELCAL